MPAAAQVDVVHGALKTLTNTPTAPNGAWSWFEDERAAIDSSNPNNVLLIVSSVSSAANGNSESGDIDFLWWNLNTGQQGEFELSNELERDDHDSAALYIRPDGRYLAMYSRHNSDQFTRWRVSTNAHDPSSWGPEITLDVGAGATYNNVHYLPDENGGAGRTYNFTRATGFDPIVQVSNDDGTTWSAAGKLLTQGDSSDRPYVKYASNGDKIHFISTEEHPRDLPNSIYHGYVKNGVLYDTTGTVRDNSVFDSTGVSPTVLTRVFANGAQFDSTTMNRAWTIDLELDNTGNPVALFTARANDSASDHRFFYARFDGADWQVHEMARAGAFLYSNENDYTGLASIDPDNPNVVYMSSEIDPRDDTSTSNYELYKGVTSDFGESWAWSAITENSTMDNLRPVVPKWNGKNTAIAWMRGAYTTYTNWSTEIVALNLIDSSPKSLLWRGDAAAPTFWDVNNTSNWDSGGGVTDVYQNGDEVAFDDTASSYQIHLVGPLMPMGVAFNNSSQNYSVTGSGIAGGGQLRVLGGGVVTLANSTNTFTGATLINNGTLALAGGATLGNSPAIRIATNGIFNVTATEGGSYTLNNQILTVEGGVVGNIIATNNSFVHVNSSSFNGNLMVQTGSLVSGTGGITGDLSAVASTVRIGGDGLEITPSQFVIDSFEDYALGDVRSVASPPWTAHQNTSFADIENDAGNKVLTFGWSGGARGVSRDLPTGSALGDDGVGTFFFRFNSKTDAPDHNFGMGDRADTSTINFDDFEAQITIRDDPSTAGTFILDANNGGVFTAPLASGLSTNTWYNVWVVVNHSSDTYDVYMNTGLADANPADKLNGISLSFRNPDPGVLNKILGYESAAPNDNGVRYDDLVYLDGADLTNPLDGLAPVPVGNGEALIIDGNFSMDSGATLEVDIATPTILDELIVSGTFTAGGLLRVSLVPGALSPQAGDIFDILDFESYDGGFAAINLPSLAPGLAWNTANLHTFGILEVVAGLPGDYNRDGSVDTADYVVWSKIDGAPQKYNTWRTYFGLTDQTNEVGVPEPLTLSLVCWLIGAGAGYRRFILRQSFSQIISVRLGISPGRHSCDTCG
jgi:autotransporter-associated beta strand protein